MIKRQRHLDNVRQLLKQSPVVVLLGAHQAGKTTLARQLLTGPKSTHAFFDLGDPRDDARLTDPLLALDSLRGLVVLDGIQDRPDLLSALRVLTERPRIKTRFLLLSNAPASVLLKQSSESLSGRMMFYELSGLALDEVGNDNLERLWLRGGFPRSYLARSGKDSARWRQDFVRSFLEQDLPRLGFNVASQTLRRFLSMLAHHHGQTWNASEFARSFGVADTTVRRYLDILVAAFMVRLLSPWAETSLRKRQVKAPRVYLADSGLLHTILNLTTKRDLEGHPKLGASWQGFMLNAVIHQLDANSEQCYFWATHAGASLDLLIVRGQQRLGFEFQRTSSPQLTRQLRSAIKDLGLERLDIVYAGRETFPLAPGVRAVAANRLRRDLTD